MALGVDEIAPASDALGLCEFVDVPIGATVGRQLDPTVGVLDGTKLVPIFWPACVGCCDVGIELGCSIGKVGSPKGTVVGSLLNGVVALAIVMLDGLALCARVGAVTRRGTGAPVGNVIDGAAVKFGVETRQGALLGQIVDEFVGKANDVLVRIVLGSEVGIVSGTFVAFPLVILGRAVGNITSATIVGALFGAVVRVGFGVLLGVAVEATVGMFIGTLDMALLGATVNDAKSVPVGSRLGVVVRALVGAFSDVLTGAIVGTLLGIVVGLAADKLVDELL